MSLYTFIPTYRADEPTIYLLQHVEKYESTITFGIYSTEQLAEYRINELIEAEPELYIYGEFTIREIHINSNYIF